MNKFFLAFVAAIAAISSLAATPASAHEWYEWHRSWAPRIVICVPPSYYNGWGCAMSQPMVIYRQPTYSMPSVPQFAGPSSPASLHEVGTWDFSPGEDMPAISASCRWRQVNPRIAGKLSYTKLCP